MISDTFIDELQKIAGYLTNEEQNKKSLQYAAVGTAAMPVTAAVGNLVADGRIMPKGTNPARWLAGKAASGAILAGGVPLVRNIIDDNINEQATERRRLATEAREAITDAGK